MNHYLSAIKAFNAMRLFLEKYYDETLSDDIGSMLGDLQFFQPDVTADPAAWYNWEKYVHQVSKSNKLTALEAFSVMRLFLEKYFDETSSEDIAAILKDIDILPNGIPKNSNIWKKWMKAISQADKEHKLAQLT